MRILLDNPNISLVKRDNDFLMSLTEGDTSIEINLSEMNTKALGLELIRMCPVLKPEIKLDGENSSYRLLANEFKELNDRDIQIWLREVQSDSLIRFLWFMKDRELIERVFKNMSQRAAEMLLEDLTMLASSCGDPDGPRTHKATILEARQELLEVVKILNRLQDEGQIR